MDTAVLERSVGVETWSRTQRVTPKKKKSFEVAGAESNEVAVDVLDALIEKWQENGINVYHDDSVYDEVLEPDDDLRRAISADEFKKRCLKVIDKIFDK
jgi:hypothetical protein